MYLHFTSLSYDIGLGGTQLARIRFDSDLNEIDIIDINTLHLCVMLKA